MFGLRASKGEIESYLQLLHAGRMFVGEKSANYFLMKRKTWNMNVLLDFGFAKN